ncbi:MAG: tRNA (adenosine(37)-N6)-threonylcarbamoyltransferase complex ATPase subunit type 1 TsaE [Alphaproteobacteria bacterium GM202ARS2]|nr:tRNA (adenosine(37)-N6)-threonylcarbamoyltransferase complex ATPase subunit type 1 TsaE [Alphaproteobacteria bacterium GM202ARS2]
MMTTAEHCLFTGCTQQDVCLLAGYVAAHLRVGDMVGLRGVVGVGKTTWARAAIQAWAHTQKTSYATVPSPTYTWLQVYEGASWTLTHVDLYRLQRDSDIEELGLEESLEQGACLVEWSDKAPHIQTMGQYLDIAFDSALDGDRHKETHRTITVRWMAESWQQRFTQEKP